MPEQPPRSTTTSGPPRPGYADDTARLGGTWRDSSKRTRPSKDWLHLSDVQSGRISRPATNWKPAFAGSHWIASRLQVLRESLPADPDAEDASGDEDLERSSFAKRALSDGRERSDQTTSPPSKRQRPRKKTLRGHTGCVNTLAWNESGTRLVSGSGGLLQDDCTIKIWDPSLIHADTPVKPLVASYHSGHVQNIFSAKFMTSSNDRKIVSCAASGHVRYLELGEVSATIAVNGLFNCHSAMTYEVLPDGDNPNLFFSCSDDGTVNQYDLRQRTSCECDGCGNHTLIDVNLSKTADLSCTLDYSKTRTLFPLVDSSGGGSTPDPATSARTRSSRLSRQLLSMVGRSSESVAVSAMSLHPLHPAYLALGCSDDTVRVFDRRMVRTPGRNWSSDPPSSSNGEVYAFRPSDYGHGRRASTSSDSDSDGSGHLENDDDDSHWETDEDVEESTHSRATSILHRGRGHSHSQRRARNPSFRRITAMKFDPVDGRHIIISYSGDSIYLIAPNAGEGVIGWATKPPIVRRLEPNVSMPKFLPPDDRDEDVVRIFKGHRNVKTMVQDHAIFYTLTSRKIKEAFFYGPNSEYIMSGSAFSKHVVNCIAPNPFDLSVAVSGIDNDIKLIVPTAERPWTGIRESNIINREYLMLLINPLQRQPE
ncbi:WD40-repeat-containing domain protein [Zopfochytrium polystomum]|nr:WD40-repeat-containing domain protein [Zopfochytrium polystomum]